MAMPSTSTRLADFVPYCMSVTTNAVSDLIAGQYRARYGLKIPEWRVMAVLGDLGSQTQRELVGATRMDKVAVNRACKSLEERGIVARSPNTLDGRSHHLGLTPEGVAMFDQIMPLALDMEKRLLACLTARESEAFQTTLRKLLERAGSMLEDDQS